MSIYERNELWEQILFSGGGALAIGATISSLFLIVEHLRHFSVPREQRWIVRILIMVPIYSVDSWFSLRYAFIAPYLNLVRDAYEGYVLFAFFSLLVVYLEGDREGTAGSVLARKGPKKHPFPLVFLPHFHPGPYFFLWVKRLVLQFAFVKPICAIAAVCLEPFGLLGDGEFAVNRGYLYFTVVTNASVTVALYALVLFYIAAKEELERFSPVAKFLSVKAVLFFTFWQSILIAVLTHFHVLTGIGNWSQHQIAVLLQDLAICLEMFLLSIFHVFAFEYLSYKDREERVAAPRQVLRNFGTTVSQRDLISTVKESYLDRTAGQTARTRVLELAQLEANEETTLLGASDELPAAEISVADLG
jgi:hypothetical protein